MRENGSDSKFPGISGASPMPKKRQNRALLTKPASSAPSYLSSNASSSFSVRNQAPSEPTVNDLLREARRANGAAKRLDVAASSSLHPTLRAVLDLPAPEPPAVRARIRGPARSRRVPGPPPPQSWLAQSRHALEGAESPFHQLRWVRARIQQQSSTLPGGYLPGQRSLEHLVLKAIATNWPWHAEYDNTYLSTLPASTRTLLLSYLAVYDEGHWPNPFPLLFPPESPRSDLDSVTRLDLTNSLGSWATTVKKLEKELVVVAEASDSSTHASDAVPESWDQEIPQTMPFRHARFANLKHLSLAINLASSAPPPSWASLISLTAHLSRLSSLSLAHWPTPTYTPNAAKGRVKIVDATGVSTPQAFGGTDMYSALDANWREAAGILKSLSRNLYCLDWLDLSGCGPWLPALTWTDEHGETGPDWNGSWRNLKTLILAVGWLPGRPPSIEDFEAAAASRSSSSVDSSRAIEHLYGGSQAIQDSLAHLAELRLSNQPRQSQPPTPASPPDLPWNVEHEREKQYFRRDVERYNAQQSTAKEIANGLRNLRRSGSGRYIKFEFGETLDASYAVD